MKRTTRRVAGAALAVLVALGAVAPAVAAPHGGPGKADKVAAKVEKHRGTAKAAEQRAAKAEVRLERMATRKGRLPRAAVDAPQADAARRGGEELAQNMKDDATTLDGLEEAEADLIRSARPLVYNGTQAEEESLLETVLGFNAWTPKPELKAMQKTIADLLAELEDEGDDSGEDEPLSPTPPSPKQSCRSPRRGPLSSGAVLSASTTVPSTSPPSRRTNFETG